MSTTELVALSYRHYRYFPGKPLTRLPDIRKHFYVSEVIPVIGLALCSFGTGVYFSKGDAKKGSTERQPSMKAWPLLMGKGAYWSGDDGMKEMIQKELRKFLELELAVP
ncbi:hypothetical protein RhiXN_08062 [Rhizoctonia solani]|uniref:Uncharacterized protein n=2 Tax=Rhizoctonia solani TaxID=456999 RepID=A0A8H8NZN6_9AGAM|nr:uncharacterized protein RhiXN_08062 [Rhizoctonia solani]QRW23026.1 hypothetical protein RhiXN_08062 [Rhizoctonia solani]